VIEELCKMIVGMRIGVRPAIRMGVSGLLSKTPQVRDILASDRALTVEQTVGIAVDLATFAVVAPRSAEPKVAMGRCHLVGVRFG
jgi:purine-nucleoside phosphorylase